MIKEYATQVLGYLASLLVLAAFCMRDMTALRMLAIASNALFIAYAALCGIYPGLLLHSVLLPMNLGGWHKSGLPRSSR